MEVLIIPAVDIMQGKCVRLIQGDPSKVKVYFDNPVEAVKQWVDQGAELIHLIDIDAALGLGQNMETIETIIKTSPIKTQVGGGIRTLEKAEKLFRIGASRVIFGTVCILNSRLIKEAVQRFRSTRVAVALDTRNGKVTFNGWRTRSEIDYLDLARSVELVGVRTIIFTSVGVDGTLRGPPIKQISKLTNTVRISVIASGGIGCLTDLVNLSRTVVEGAIVGTALYEGKFTLKEAMEAVKNVG